MAAWREIILKEAKTIYIRSSAQQVASEENEV